MKYVIIISLICWVNINYAQMIQKETYSSAGEVIHSQELSIDYTVGETFVFKGVGDGVLLFSGFENSNNEVITGSKELTSGHIDVFPIPVKTILTVESQNDDWENLSIMSLDGKLIRKEKFTAKTQQIDLRSLSKGTYLCEFTKGENRVTYKISKE